MAREADPDCFLVLQWPDGSLRLLVTRPGGDFSIGFEGSSAHTHGSILAELYGGTKEEAVGRYISDIIEGRRDAVVLSKDGVMIDAWISDLRDDFFYEDPRNDPNLEPGETIEVKSWRS